MNGKLTLFVDQWGNTYLVKTLKELRGQLSGAVSKMYADKKDGTTVHIGYVIGRHWLTAYQRVELPA